MNEIEAALHSETMFEVIGNAHLESCFCVSKLATSSIGAVGAAMSRLIKDAGLSNTPPKAIVNQSLASLWFARSIYPIQWELPPVWDSLSGLYQTNDGWIRLHTNLPHHRSAALEVLESGDNKQKLTAEILNWASDQLESEIVNAGGVAAALRSRSAWQEHAQGRALSSEPLVTWSKPNKCRLRFQPKSADRPLRGLRVLDLTRVVAGPVATRTLAGFGANVLRIDPPNWDEPNVVPDITLGKKCARLSLSEKMDRDVFESLLANADVLIHGYRPGALEGLGYGDKIRRALSPNLIEVSLNAYGWSGPWSGRRGFDSLVQMSCGIADTGMQWAHQSQPVPLPVQALDHATGYLMAAAAIRAISEAICHGQACSARLSLARTAELLIDHPQPELNTYLSLAPNQKHFQAKAEATPWGKANRLKPPIKIAGVKMRWEHAASNLGSSKPRW